MNALAQLIEIYGSPEHERQDPLAQLIEIYKKEVA